MENKDQPAFPIFLQEGLSSNCHVDPGITKREYFAGLAMQGMCGFEFRPCLESIAEQSVQLADMLLAELDKK